jgi:hypothetical protein
VQLEVLPVKGTPPEVKVDLSYESARVALRADASYPNFVVKIHIGAIYLGINMSVGRRVFLYEELEQKRGWNDGGGGRRFTLAKGLLKIATPAGNNQHPIDYEDVVAQLLEATDNDNIEVELSFFGDEVTKVEVLQPPDATSIAELRLLEAVLGQWDLTEDDVDLRTILQRVTLKKVLTLKPP